MTTFHFVSFSYLHRANLYIQEHYRTTMLTIISLVCRPAETYIADRLPAPTRRYFVVSHWRIYVAWV